MLQAAQNREKEAKIRIFQYDKKWIWEVSNMCFLNKIIRIPISFLDNITIFLNLYDKIKTYPSAFEK